MAFDNILDHEIRGYHANQGRIKYLESQVNGLLKLLEQKYILSDHKILVCAKCHTTLSTQKGSQENDAPQPTENKDTYGG